MSGVRVRFAPSPTGYFHIGSARTALYNWLYARGSNGKFILRIEDTDEIRSTLSSIKSIINGLKYMGITWDEGPFIARNAEGVEEMTSMGPAGPYFQTLRKNFYQKFADRMLEEENAYFCFCAPEELEERRKKKKESGGPLGYDGFCRNLTRKERAEFQAKGRKPVIRFKVPGEKKITFNDKIRGEISVMPDAVTDFIIMRSNGTPTYNFACVADDHLMKITDVIRGEDHISNTPKQVLLYEALGWEKPNFAHLTMILDTDGSRLSKRSGARSLLEYEEEGIIREAMVNYLALLGWGTAESQNIFTREELISKFSLSRCTSSSAIFDNNKLFWLNAQHIKNLAPQDIYRRSFRFLKEAGLDVYPEEKITSAISLEKEKIKKLTDIPGLIGFLVSDEFEYEKEVAEKAPETCPVLVKLRGALVEIKDFKASGIEQRVRQFAKEEGLKTRDVFHPLRWAVSGRSRGPSLFEMCEFLGRETVLKRIGNYVEKFGE